MMRSTEDLIKEVEERNDKIGEGSNELERFHNIGYKAGLDYALMLIKLFKAYGTEI